MEIPVTGRDATGLPIGPLRIPFDGRPEFGGREGSAGRQTLHGAGDVNADEDTADVEDDGAKPRAWHGRFNLLVKYDRSRRVRGGPPGAQHTDHGGKN